MESALLVKIALARIWRNLHGPIIEVNIKELIDRLGNKISEHELMNLFKIGNTDDSINYYYHYNERMYGIQDGRWLNEFIGSSKDIHYWITPWGGCVKHYFSQKHLSLSYAKEYIIKLRQIRASIEKNGFHPEKHGYITGQLLIDHEGNKKFIIWNGHRRALSLADLGYKKIRVEISGGDRWEGKIKNHTVKLCQLKKWPNVKNSLYSKEEARQFFTKYFQ